MELRILNTSTLMSTIHIHEQLHSCIITNFIVYAINYNPLSNYIFYLNLSFLFLESFLIVRSKPHLVGGNPLSRYWEPRLLPIVGKGMDLNRESTTATSLNY